jgi:hypothetical protein
MLTVGMIARGDLNITFCYFVPIPPDPPPWRATGHGRETANLSMTWIRL